MILADQIDVPDGIRPIGPILAYRVAATTGGQVRPFIFGNPVDASDPSGVLSASAAPAQTVVTTDSSSPAIPTQPIAASLGDPFGSGVPAVTLPGFAGLPGWLQIAIVVSVIWILWRMLK